MAEMISAIDSLTDEDDVNERKPTPAAAEMEVRSDSAVAEEEDVAPPLLKALTVLVSWAEIRGGPLESAVTPTPNTSSGTMLGDFCNFMNPNPPIIFPPKNHENLHISTDPSLIPEQISQIHKNSASVDQQYAYSNSGSDSDSDSIANSMSSSTFSPLDSTPIAHSPLFSIPKAKPAAINLDSWTRILHTKVSGIMPFIWGLSRGVLWTFRSAAITALLVAFLYFRQRRKLRAVESSKARLLGIIGEKDEKINQLLDQISRMNQVLLAAAVARLGVGTPSGN